MSSCSTARFICRPQARRGGRISRRPYSGRGALRHRRHRGPVRPTCRTCCRAPDQFAEPVGALGIGDGMTIVVYDGIGLFGAPRVWWTFRVFGAENVFVLDGGLPKWKAEGRPLEAGPAKRARAKTFTPKLQPRWSPRSTTCRWPCSTRPRRSSMRGRPTAFAAKRRSRAPGLRGGHMPGAFNVPFDHRASRTAGSRRPNSSRRLRGRPASISTSR